MKYFSVSLTPEQINAKFKSRSRFIKKVELKNVAQLSEASPDSVCFFDQPKFLQQLKNCQAGLIFVPLDFKVDLKPDSNLIFVEKPYFAFMQLIKYWQQIDSGPNVNNISDKAIVNPSVKLGKNVSLGHFVVIEDSCEIGDNTVIESNTVIHKNVKVGSNCHFFPNVTIYEDCIIQDNVILHAGCVIGSDGFGYLLHEGKQEKIPQVGNAVIQSNVEIGSNTSVDRATLGSTIIGEGTKIDNLVQIGHNCVIGKNSILCAQVGLAGSTIIGDGVYLGGQVGVAGHLKIENGAMIGAQSGVSGSVPENAKYFGTPAIEAGLRKRIMASEKKLPEIIRFFKKQIKKMD
jgi:UDP-3-O-[3-hydroxymyristoyl] glucosamine N-acyltransferase